MPTNLDLKDRIILEAIKDAKGEVSRKELYESSEELRSHYKSDDSMSRKLKNLRDERNLITSQRSGRKTLYSTTDKGRRILHRTLNEVNDKDGMSYGDKVREFEAFIEENSKMQNEKIKVESGRRYAVLDYQELDKFNVDLGDHLIKEPKSTIEALQEAIQTFITRKDTIDIRIQNVYDIDTKSVGRIRSGDVNQLVMTEGVIKNVSKPQAIYDKAIFECTQCGDRLEKVQTDWSKLKSPFKCDCGSKKFKIVEKFMKTMRVVSVKPKPGQSGSQAIKVYLIGSLAEEREDLVGEIGKPVRVIGYLQEKEKRGKEYLDLELNANNIVLEEEKWEDKDLDEDRIEKIEDVPEEQENVPQHLAKSLGYEKFHGMETYKMGLILWLLGKTDDYGNTHLLIIGDPGTAKTHLGKYVKENFGRILDSMATGASGVGLTAAVRKDEMTGEYVAEAGSIPMADGGYHITDEMDKLPNQFYKHYNEFMSEQQISIDKAGISTSLPANVSELSIANPIDRRFDRETPNYKQIPIEDEDLRNRYSIIMSIEANQDNENEEREKFWKIINRGKGEVHGEYEYMEEDLLFDYLFYASELEPELTEEAAQHLYEKYMSLWNSQNPDENIIETRMINNLAAISIAFARMNLDEEVGKKHINQTLEFVGASFETMDFTLGKDSFDDMAQNPKRKKKQVVEVIDQLIDENGGNQVEKEKVVEACDLPESTVEEVMEKVEDQGEYFEPNAGFIQKLD